MKQKLKTLEVLNFIKRYSLFLIFHFTVISLAQTKIKGQLLDINGEAIKMGIVVMKSEKAVRAYCKTNNEGYYELTTNERGVFILVFTAINFEVHLVKIEILDKITEIITNITLKNKPLELKEIIITQERPITIKKDTIIFLAKSFLQGNEQVVEDLLKKIPGLTVTEDGTVKIGNQEVEKVMIDGDDFFERGYKLITKNMPVRPIEKVELYQNYSNNKHLKGIEKSNKVALNLTLKDDFKRQWFGNLELGYGVPSENRYWLRSNLMNFGKKNKYYFLSNLNNIGLDATGDINNIIRPFRMDDIGTIGDDQNAQSLLSLNNYNVNLKEKRINLNNTEMLAINSIYTLSTKSKLKVFGFFNADEINYFRNSFQSVSVGNTNFNNIEDFQGKNSKITSFGKVDFITDISKTITIEYTGKFNATNENNISNLNFNGKKLIEKLKSQNQLIDQKISYTNKFEPKKVLILSARYINEKTPQIYTANQFLYQDLFSINANNILQTSQNKMQFAGIQAHFLERKKNNNLIELQIGNYFHQNKFSSNLTLKNNDINLVEPIDFQNNINYVTNDLYLKTKYLFNIAKFNLSPSINFQQIFNNKESQGTNKTQNLFIINPQIGLSYEINKKNKLTTMYSFNTTNVGIIDIFDNFVQTSFRSFDKGTGSFNQLNQSSLVTNYTLGSWGDKFFANASILMNRNHDFLSTNSFISQNYSQTEKIIIKNQDFLSINVNVDKYFKAITSNLKFTISATESNFKNIVNNSDFREVKQQTLIYGYELRSGFKKIFNYHIGSKWTSNKIQTTLKNTFTDNMTFIDLSFVFNTQFNFQIQSERYFFGNLEKNSNKYYFLDLEIRYQPKNSKVHFALSGNNLFNVSVFKNYSITDVSISQTEFRLQPRYLLLKMEVKL